MFGNSAFGDSYGVTIFIALLKGLCLGLKDMDSLDNAAGFLNIGQDAHSIMAGLR